MAGQPRTFSLMHLTSLHMRPHIRRSTKHTCTARNLRSGVERWCMTATEIAKSYAEASVPSARPTRPKHPGGLTSRAQTYKYPPPPGILFHARTHTVSARLFPRNAQ